MGLPNVNMLPNVNIMQANLPNVDCKKPLSTLGKQLFTINIRQVYLPNVNIRHIEMFLIWTRVCRCNILSIFVFKPFFGTTTYETNKTQI